MSKKGKGGIRVVRPSRLLRGADRRVQGINENVDSITLRGGRFKAKVTDAILDPGVTLERSVDGASTLAIPVLDPDGELREGSLLRHAYRLELDGLGFVFVGFSKSGDVLTLNHEAENVNRLRQKKGAVKVYRDKWTRAEFLASLVTDVKAPQIPFFSPELHTEQPIETAKQEIDVSQSAGATRGKGLDTSADLRVKGVPANKEQLRNGEIVLRVGASLKAPRGAMVAAIMAGTQENNMMNSTNDGYFAMLDSTASLYGLDKSDLAACAHQAYTDGFWHAGLIESVKKGLPLGEACQEMEGSAYPTLYAQWQDQGEKWVDAFEGGKITGGEEITFESPKRYAFERKENESTWACGARLAEEVNWRWFEAAGVVYYIAETDLLASNVRMDVRHKADGVEIADYDYDTGKKVDEVRLTAYAKDWSAPPGTVAKVAGEGPVDGLYIVSMISSNLHTNLCDITLKRPSKPLPEPAPETKSTTVGAGPSAGSSAGGGEAMAKMIAEADRIDKLQQPYLWGGGHGSSTSRSGPWDCSGAVSRVLDVAGLLPGGTPVSSDVFPRFLEEGGKGQHCTVYANADHVIMELNGRLWGTGDGGGAQWLQPGVSGRFSNPYTTCHPKGL